MADSVGYDAAPPTSQYNKFAMDTLMDGADDPSKAAPPPEAQAPPIDPQIQTAINTSVAKAFQTAAMALQMPAQDPDASAVPEPAEDAGDQPPATEEA